MTRARIGLQRERWNGVPLVVAHVVPLDGEAALADATAKLLGSEPLTTDGWDRQPQETFRTLCGERTAPHFAQPQFGGPGQGALVWRSWRWCPVCAKLDRPRLP